MKGKYLIAIAFLASWTVIRADDEAPITFEDEYGCPAPPDPCPPKLLRHEMNCNEYYECKNGQAILRTCTAGLFFSKQWNGCVNQAISDCAVPTPPPTSPPTPTPTSPPPPPTPTPTSIPNECPVVDPSPPILLNHETDCAKYYECRKGVKIPHSCAAGLFFSRQWYGCVKEEISDCAPIPTPDPGNECLDGELTVHECECNQFYQCLNGRKALRFCPSEYHFNPYDKKCQPGSECNFCKEGEYTYHECDCDKFYECKNGNKALRECYSGTVFNGNTCVPGICNK